MASSAVRVTMVLRRPSCAAWMLASWEATFLRMAPMKSGSQLAWSSAELAAVSDPPDQLLERLPVELPITVTDGKELPLAERRLARACSMFESAVRRSRFDFSARSSSEVSIGSLNTVHHCERAASSTGPGTSPPARVVFQF